MQDSWRGKISSFGACGIFVVMVSRILVIAYSLRKTIVPRNEIPTAINTLTMFAHFCAFPLSLLPHHILLCFPWLRKFHSECAQQRYVVNTYKHKSLPVNGPFGTFKLFLFCEFISMTFTPFSTGVFLGQ